MPLTVKATSRVAINRQAFDEIQLGAADGLFDLAVRIVEGAHPPDAPPYGQGLVEGGGAVAWIGKKKVAGTTIGGRQIKKPRDLKLSDGEVTAIAGFGFPARFVEIGTVDTPAEPFLTSSVAREVPEVDVVMSAAMKRRLGQ